MARSTPPRASAFSRFFFAEEVPYGLALMRMILPLVLFTLAVFRWPHVRELYSTDGAVVQLSHGFAYGAWLPELSAPIAIALFTLMMFALLASSVGWHTRVSLGIAWVLYTYFNFLDVLSTITKYSVISSHLMLLLMLSPCGTIWSIDAWRKRKQRIAAGETNPTPPTSPIWTRRLMQLLMGIVYFGAAITKLQTPAFFSGDQLRYWMNTMVNHSHPLGDYLTLYPSLLGAFAYITIVWEIVFIFLCWRGPSRWVVLGVGLLFHIMTTITLGLYVFPVVCATSYLSFLSERDVLGIRNWLTSRFAWLTKIPTAFPRMSLPTGSDSAVPSPLAYSLAGVLICIIGLGAEHQLDPYGERGANGKLTLKPMASERVAELLSERDALEERDKFFTLQIGTTLVAGSLVESKRVFREGDEAIAQCTLNPPHEDLYVECLIYDEHEQMVDRSPAIVGREDLRATFPFTIGGKLTPGEYTVRIRSSNEEVLSRSFQVLGN